MASTRNKNTPGDYALEKMKHAHGAQYLSYPISDNQLCLITLAMVLYPLKHAEMNWLLMHVILSRNFSESVQIIWKCLIKRLILN